MSEIDDIFNKHYKAGDITKPKPGAEPPPTPGSIGFLNGALDLGPISTFARNAVNKGTFGIADRVAAMLPESMTGTKDLESVRKKGADMRARDPWAATGGDVAGLAAQQFPVLKAMRAGTAAVPAAAAVHRVLTGGSIPANIAGGMLTGGATAGVNAVADNAWGERQGQVGIGDAAKEIGLGVLGGGIGGGVGGAIAGKAINRAGTQIPSGILADTAAAADPTKLAKFGLTGAAAPNAEQLLRMVPGAAKDKYAPMVGEIFERAGKGASDDLFPALRTNLGAQAPGKVNPGYRGSFEQRAAVAAQDAKDAAKAVAKGAPAKEVKAASFLPAETRDTAKMLRDAAINKTAANPVIPRAFESRFVKEAADRASDPAVTAQASNLLSKLDPTIARQLAKTVEAGEFKGMEHALRSGPRTKPVVPEGKPPDMKLDIPGISDVADVLRNLYASTIKKRAFNQAGEAGEALVTQPVKALGDMGRRTAGQTAIGMAGYPASELLLANWARKLGIVPEGTPIR